MKYFDRQRQLISDATFLSQVKEVSQTNLERCYQCLTCSLGCPTTFAMDYLPNQIVRMVRLGLKQETLTSATIWVCADCATCATRCPNNVDLPKLMDTLREMSLLEKVAIKERRIAAFHDSFLTSLKRWGKPHELSLLLWFKLKTGDFFSDLGLGLRMLVKGKFKVFPPGFTSLKEVRTIFHRVNQKLTTEEKH